jgi:hypothetical protein
LALAYGGAMSGHGMALAQKKPGDAAQIEPPLPAVHA